MASPQDVPGPLQGRRILTTRPRAAAHAQRDRFLALGCDAVALPCLEFREPEDLQAFDRTLASPDQFDGVILSSRAGVEAFAQALARLGMDARTLAGHTLLAVGRATASACAAAKLVPDLVPAHASSEGIAQALAEQDALDRRWVHVRARDGRDVLSDAISAAGGHYRLAIGYRTERPAPPAGAIDWLRQGVDAICLHSGRTGQHLRETLGEALPERTDEILGAAALVSAGPVTTKALQEQGYEVAATAVSPGDDGMLQAVSEFFRAQRGT